MIIYDILTRYGLCCAIQNRMCYKSLEPYAKIPTWSVNLQIVAWFTGPGRCGMLHNLAPNLTAMYLTFVTTTGGVRPKCVMQGKKGRHFWGHPMHIHLLNAWVRDDHAKGLLRHQSHVSLAITMQTLQIRLQLQILFVAIVVQQFCIFFSSWENRDFPNYFLTKIIYIQMVKPIHAAIKLARQKLNLNYLLLLENTFSSICYYFNIIEIRRFIMSIG